MCDIVSLFKDNNKIKAEDVLEQYYKPWDPSIEPVAKHKKSNKILLEHLTTGCEFTFTTPPVSVLYSTINNFNDKKHNLVISKTWPQPWNGKTLPYMQNEEHQKIWFSKLEKITYQCLRVAWQERDLFLEATEAAWECTNMDSETPEVDAWNTFLSNANLPFTQTSWTLKKNTTKGKDKQYVTIVDIANMEHTGNVIIENNAIISVSIKLWPYHMNKHCYGVAAIIGDAGIKLYDKGGVKEARNEIKIPHTCIVKAGPSHTFIYDVFGGLYRFKVHGTICDDGHLVVTNDNYVFKGEMFMCEFSKMLEHFKKHNIHCEQNIIIHDWVHNNFYLGSALGCFKGYVTLECNVVGGNLIYKLIKLN